ncbi:hypothetical protein [Bradyrhizobium sacchari]|uniref:Uncharacterized protein n=1 Tax=Bradyrhizobium sacchari TaxID=1399419 RepID=A0A560J5B2_9BRAD|nr:hypothetical protein [Bradyrhizobium sacchari]TWB47269.1 hypothetical protein FBZ94_12023 [Bradyrhizobium sacchari]TWB66015.1 hypothetical protein FBZ95_11911 [Bradyrhizobium sacchari]
MTLAPPTIRPLSGDVSTCHETSNPDSASGWLWIDTKNIHAYEDKYVHSATLSAFDVIAQTIKDLGGEKACIGVGLGGYYYSAKAHADLIRALPQASFVDADLLVNWIRIVKSPAELALMRQAGQLLMR